MALLDPRHLAISLNGRACGGSWEETGGSIVCIQMALNLILETTQARPLHLAGNLQISREMALLSLPPRNQPRWQRGLLGRNRRFNISQTDGSGFDPWNNTVDVSAFTGNLQIYTQMTLLHPHNLSKQDKLGLLGINRRFNISHTYGSGFDPWNSRAEASVLTGNLWISTQMALLDSRNLAINLVGRACRCPWEETEGSMFRKQMALDLILKTTEPRPPLWQEMNKSINRWLCSILETSLSASSAGHAGPPAKKQEVQILHTYGSGFDPWNNTAETSALTGNSQISTQMALLPPRNLSEQGRLGLPGINRRFNISHTDGSGFDPWNSRAKDSALTGYLQIYTQMALLHPHHLAISLIGRALVGPWEETEGSIFCSQTALDLILETTEPRPLLWQEINKSIHR